jgi:hypothetical protein
MRGGGERGDTNEIAHGAPARIYPSAGNEGFDSRSDESVISLNLSVPASSADFAEKRPTTGEEDRETKNSARR